MIQIGNFIFKYRNALFSFLYLLVFLPSKPLFSPDSFGAFYYVYAISIGLFLTVSGQLLRGATIGLAYIVRGGKDKKVYANKLVTNGLFWHVRNPLYIGNMLMLLGAGILANSLLFTAVIVPLFCVMYQAIVIAEEAFLEKKFGQQFKEYTSKVNRWIPQIKNLSKTFEQMSFQWRRWLTKEYGTHFVWLVGLISIIVIKYPFLFTDMNSRLSWAFSAIIIVVGYYIFIRYMKKSGQWH